MDPILTPLVISMLIYTVCINSKTRYKNSKQIAPLYLASRWKTLVFIFLKHARIQGVNFIASFIIQRVFYPNSLTSFFSIVIFCLFSLTHFTFLALSTSHHELILIAGTHVLWFTDISWLVFILGFLFITILIGLCINMLHHPIFHEAISRKPNFILFLVTSLISYCIYKKQGIHHYVPLPHVIAIFTIITITFLESTIHNNLDVLIRIRTHFNLYRLTHYRLHPKMLPASLIKTLKFSFFSILLSLLIMIFEGYTFIDLLSCFFTVSLSLTSFLDSFLWHHLTHGSLLYYKPIIRLLLSSSLMTYQSVYCVYVLTHKAIETHVMKTFQSYVPSLFALISFGIILFQIWHISHLFNIDTHKKKRII